MNSKDIQFISEAYFEIYEANRGEQYRGLTPKERKIERNQREPAGSALGDMTTKDPLTRRRRFRHQQLRGISPKKRRADNEREYVHYKNEWEKRNPGKTYGNDDYDDYDDYDHSQESGPYDNIPRMPGNTPGRRKPLGRNNVRRVQPYLDFSRARTRRREELAQEREKENQKQREIDRQNNSNHWKKFMAMRDMENRINKPGNKIVPFQREEIELILNYLLDEGYADSFDTAELIFENMSDKWKYKIVEDFKPLTSKNEGRVKQRLGDLGREVQVLGATYKELGRKPLAKFRPGIKKRRQEIAKTIRKKARLAQNATDALTDASISRSANIEFRRQELLKKLKDLEN